MSKPSHNEKIIYELLHGVDGDIAGYTCKDYIEKCFLPDATLYVGDKIFSGRTDIIKVNQEFGDAVPDLNYKIEDLLTCDDKIAIRWKVTGTAVADYGNFKAGDAIDQWGLSQFEFKDGRISKNWCCVASKKGLL